MKYLRRFSLFVLSLVMFVGIFSTTAHADTISNFNVIGDVKIYYSSNVYYNGELSKFEDIGGLISGLPMDYNTLFEYKLTIGNEDGSLIAKKGEKFNISIQNMVFTVKINGIDYNWSKADKTDKTLMLVHTDGSYTYLYDGIDWNFTSGNNSHNVSIEATTNKDVRKIIYLESAKQWEQTGLHGVYDGNCNFGYLPSITIDIESKEVGLLENIKGGIANLFDAIKNLPQKIWEVVSEGLKSLFVPSDEYVENWINEQKSKSEAKLGALYEVTFIMTDSWEQIKLADSTDTITLPETTINFGDTPFSFGGYEVKIVPDGFEVLVNAVKLIIGIVCSAAFINGIRNRYDEVMGVEK